MAGLPPITDSENSLLAAIISSPDDDAPRLIYADWLDEHGDSEQAAFIRASIRHARMDSAAEGWYQLYVQLFEQWTKSCRSWLSRLGIAYDARDDDVERGLLSRASYFDVNGFLVDADNLFAYAPVKELLVCGDSEESRALDDDFFGRLAGLPGLSRIGELYFRNNRRPVSPQGITAFVHSPNIGALRVLGLEDFQLTDQHAEVLANAPNLANLEELHLPLNEFTPAGAFAIFRSPYLARLKWLSFEEGLYVSPHSPFDVRQRSELMTAMRARFGPPCEGRNYL